MAGAPIDGGVTGFSGAVGAMAAGAGDASSVIRGSVTGFRTDALILLKARPGLSRPTPVASSRPTGPRSSAVSRMILRTSLLDSLGSADQSNAASAETCGAAAEVPVPEPYAAPALPARQMVLAMFTPGAEMDTYG